MRLALLDIDGLVANDSHRVDHAVNRRWSQYFDPKTVAQDTVWPQGRQLAQRLLAEGWTIAYLTGRRAVLRTTTESWLDQHGFPIGRLIMREASWQSDFQNKPLAVFKVETIRALLQREDIESLVLYDDDPEVVRHVQDEVGSPYAVGCYWNIKPKALIKKATA
jgi:hypothetical protein